MSPMQLLGGDDAGAEAEHWSVFADVFEKEVRRRRPPARAAPALLSLSRLLRHSSPTRGPAWHIPA